MKSRPTNNKPSSPDLPRYFQYDNTHTDLIKKVDPKLGIVIDEIGHICRKVVPDPFHGLIHSILGQQIRANTHALVWARFLDAYGELTPGQILELGEKPLKAIGMSTRKAGYILSVAEEFATSGLSREELDSLGDYTLAQRLLPIRGVGPWTIAMLKIFTLHRMDVIPYEDLGIRNALMKLHGYKTMSFSRFIEKTRKYSWASSVASLYLWEYLKRG